MEQEEHAHEVNNEESVVDTQHEAHTHAHKRLIIGAGALAVIIVAALIIWPKWGDAIKEKCFGDGEVCEVPIFE